MTAGLGFAWQSEELPPLIDRELFFGDPEISNSELSPNGEFISFIKPYKDVRNIWVKGLDEPFDAARPITADERPVPGYFWSRDSRYILYVQDKGGNENFHVYAVDPTAEPEAETGVPPARDLTPIEGVRAYIYAVPKPTPDEIIIGLNDRDPAYHDVYRLSISTGERELLIENTDKLASFIFDLKGNPRLAIRQMEDAGMEVLRIDEDTLTQVYSVNFEETVSPIRFHKDGERVYMITNKGEDVDLTRLTLFNPQTAELELVESDPEGEVDFGGAEFSNKTDELIATIYRGDRVRIYPKTEQAEKDLQILRAELPEGNLNVQSSTRDMRLHLVSVSRDVDPGSVYLYNRETGDVELLYRSRPKLKSEHLASMKPIRYKTRDGVEIPAYFTLPKGVEPRNLPTIINPHGGPWGRDYWGYDSYAQFLANRGYAVLQPNFRGSAGFGKEFLNAGNEEWGTGLMQHDISDGVQHLIDEGIADPDRIGIFGGSYGGYATLAGVAFTPELYAAGVSYVGPSNLITLLKSIPPYWGPIKKMFHKRVGDPEDPQDRKRLMEQSPLFSADQIQVPLLVIQGANDPRVKKAESEQIVIALRERGQDVEYLLAQDEGHGFRDRENRLAVAAALEKFFAKQLGGRYQEEMSEEIAQTVAELTVDVNTVTLPDTTLAAYAETAPLPKPASVALQPMTAQYTANVEARGQEITMDVSRKVEAAELDGNPVWKIMSSSKSPMGAGADTFYIDKKTLMPIQRSATQGAAVIKMTYSSDAIKGKMQMGSREMPIEVDLTAPVFGDGAALEAAIASLPLKEGYETTFRTFDLVSRKVRPMSLKVTGSETVEVKVGTFETFKVELQPLDGEPGGSTMFIDKKAPHCVVRGITKLPPMAGGGTVTSELNSFGLTTAK
ncbi:prolyl oligopeptidase family serine peptidase [candidate division KSB1 bacterium]|nr:prolyl oligopeptidase family serine peptidase [candidate division KSB1 bacterium]NIR69411.1 prolyl oligopeptidase family serine peptidase [candidate division KSB1 bacterium]NIS24209.1 prolyl oligopeptidase family serine peptidase [candidate division KSB1 bacterium]NIT71123.1 prolyl oligopeptidase family serine peptidase [candidate division KSB1 bacterium]NIU24828.1 prolyl oligopeptidase family serine peptidase [candidate division KSB1 bacterium]